MATISNTPRPAYAWDSTDNCWYPIGTGAHSHNEIPVTTVDAKGDLIVGTGADAVARRAVGADGSILVADSTQTTGVNWAGTMQYAGKNKIINGDFGVWQRGTTFNSPADNSYSADRWVLVFNGTGATRSITQQTFTPGTAPVAGYESQYFLRYNQTVAGTGTTFSTIGQRIDDVRTLAGQTVTLSFWAKADATRTLPFVNVVQRFGSGGSSETIPLSNTTTTLTTSWQRFTYTFNMPSVSGKTIGTNSYVLVEFYTMLNLVHTIDLWGVQLEAGSVATPFVPAGGGQQQAELALCERYYFRPGNTDIFGSYSDGYAQNSTASWFTVAFPTRMRTKPSSIDFSNLCVARHGSVVFAATAVLLDGGCRTDTSAIINVQVASGLTAGDGYTLANNNNASGYIAFNAEL